MSTFSSHLRFSVMIFIDTLELGASQSALALIILLIRPETSSSWLLSSMVPGNTYLKFDIRKQENMLSSSRKSRSCSKTMTCSKMRWPKSDWESQLINPNWTFRELRSLAIPRWARESWRKWTGNWGISGENKQPGNPQIERGWVEAARSEAWCRGNARCHCKGSQVQSL